jgi:hypothetical protein
MVLSFSKGLLAFDRSVTMIHAKLPAFAFLLAPSAFALYPFPVASTTCETCAYIVWRTDQPGTSQVNYGATASYGSSTAKDSTLVTYHQQTITGLSPGTTYHFQVVSIDGSNNTAASVDYTFTTLPAPAGTVKTVKPSGGNYTSVQACANAASPGWTCEVYSGGASDTSIVSVGAAHGGSAGSPVTFLAHDAVRLPGFSISSGASYVTIEGFELTTAPYAAYQTCSINNTLTITGPNADYIILQSNYAHNTYYGLFVRTTIASGGNPGTYSNHSQIIGNIMAFAGFTTTNPTLKTAGSADTPCSTTSAGSPGMQLAGDYNLVDSNYFTEADHITYAEGQYNIFRRNVMSDTHPQDWGALPTSDHIDFFHPAQSVTNSLHMRHNVLENNQEYRTDDSDQHFYLASGCSDQSASQIATGDGSTKTFSGTLSLTNANGTDTGIAVFSVLIAVNAQNLGCSGSQYGNVTVSAVDDGFGNLVNYPGASGVSSGSINYSTGAFSVTFSSAPGKGVPVTAYWSLLNYGSHDMIVRYNTAYYLGSSFVGPSYGGTPGMRVYNNTVYHVSYDGGATIQSTNSANSYVGLSDANHHWADLNNLFYDAVSTSATQPWGPFYALSPPAIRPGYSLVYNSSCAPTCSYASGTTSAPGMILNANPFFANPQTYDFSLQSGSRAQNSGSYLTTVAAKDSGSGTSLIVNDAGFFQSGYGIPGVSADCISVTTVTNHVCITAINYQTNTLTLTSSISRSPGDPIWLYSDSTGRAVLSGPPNIGASVEVLQGIPSPYLVTNVQ